MSEIESYFLFWSNYDGMISEQFESNPEGNFKLSQRVGELHQKYPDGDYGFTIHGIIKGIKCSVEPVTVTTAFKVNP